MAFSSITNLDVSAAQSRSRELKDRLLSSDSPTYVTGPRGQGSGERVLLLGGTGYIGRALAPELAARGYRPVILARDAAVASAPEFR